MPEGIIEDLCSDGTAPRGASRAGLPAEAVSKRGVLITTLSSPVINPYLLFVKIAVSFILSVFEKCRHTR